MEKTSKITKSEFKNEWKNQQTGTVVYYHDLEYENCDKGSIGTKEKNPAKIAVGQELAYTLDNGKIKAVQQSAIKGGLKQEPFEHKAAGYAMSYAKDLIVSDKVNIDQLLLVADKIYNWLISKKTIT